MAIFKQERIMSQRANPDGTGHEPSLSTGLHPDLTGMEPALGTRPLLQNEAQIALAGLQRRFGNRNALRSLLLTMRYGSASQRIAAARAIADSPLAEAIE